MGEVIDALKSGRFNESESAKLVMQEVTGDMQSRFEELEGELKVLRTENAKLKVDAGRATQY